MNFTLNKATGVATSDCGHYEIRVSLINAQPWYNGWYLPSHRNIEASHDKEAVKIALQKHKKRVDDLNPNRPRET